MKSKVVHRSEPGGLKGWNPFVMCGRHWVEHQTEKHADVTCKTCLRVTHARRALSYRLAKITGGEQGSKNLRWCGLRKHATP